MPLERKRGATILKTSVLGTLRTFCSLLQNLLHFCYQNVFQSFFYLIPAGKEIAILDNP